jgi:hypothetical protein
MMPGAPRLIPHTGTTSATWWKAAAVSVICPPRERYAN